MTDPTPSDLDYFVMPRTLRLSQSAITFARAFVKQFQGIMLARDMILVFGWGLNRTLRRGSEVIDLGPAFDLGLIERSVVPAAKVSKESGLDFAIQIPLWIVEASHERLIDFDESDPKFTKLTLR